jgi:hypothetical protein
MSIQPFGAEAREENLLSAAQMFAALARTEAGNQAIVSAVAEGFPWARNLSAAEQAEFAAELIATLAEAADLVIDNNAHELVADWRATARIKADRNAYQQALTPTGGDNGPGGGTA